MVSKPSIAMLNPTTWKFMLTLCQQRGQCGGSNYPGPTSCYGSNYCSTMNPYYAQCVPGPVADGDGQTLYGQCGGQNWGGKTSCQPPATCSAFHQYYSQCLY